MNQSPGLTLTAPAPRGRLARILARILAWFRRPAPRNGVIRPEAMTRHTLRDIGLAEDVRGNHLLGDAWLRR
ncbi:MAG TPA: hypothetical protein PLR41_19465 [Alphaproteobacteria bacterium]|nr:hypothetical protein [Alphaproteobacteria bacterium]